MIKLENYEVVGWEHAIRGMRNPKNSWHLMDSGFDVDTTSCEECPYNIDDNLMECAEHSDCINIGPRDKKLMMQLAKGGPVHAKYRRMITVYVDITAPLYWWKEFDTYKVGTVANSCSTMHKIHAKEFTLEDFSCEYLEHGYLNTLKNIIPILNLARIKFLETGDKKYWWQMIQLLPSSYNQKRTVMLSYEVLANMHRWRKKIPHKLDEWIEFGRWIESLPYSEIITGGNSDES